MIRRISCAGWIKCVFSKFLVNLPAIHPVVLTHLHHKASPNSCAALGRSMPGIFPGIVQGGRMKVNTLRRRQTLLSLAERKKPATRCVCKSLSLTLQLI